MGLTIRALYTDAPSYDMGAVSFYRLRRDIAQHISNDFGDWYRSFYTNDDPVLEVGLDEIIKKNKLKNRFLDFMFASDIEYKLSPFKCKAVYDIIKDMESTHLYGYTAYSEECMNIENFKEMLLNCFNTRSYLIWY